MLGMLLLSAVGPVEKVVRGAYRNLALAGTALGALGMERCFFDFEEYRGDMTTDRKSVV